MMKLKSISLVFISVALIGCVGIGPYSKADKHSKKEFDYLSENRLHLQAIYLGTMTFTAFELREQNYFTIFRHTALAGWQHYFGTFYRLNNSDTLVLCAENNHAQRFNYAIIRDKDVVLKISLEDTLRRPLLLRTRLNTLSASQSSFRWLNDSSVEIQSDSTIGNELPNRKR